MALGTQVIYLIGTDLLDDTHQVHGIGEITVVQDKVLVFYMRILI
jgi:hypothetical protein